MITAHTLIGAVFTLILLTAQPLQALDHVVQNLNDPHLYCGQEPALDLFNGVMNALSEPEATAAQLSLKRGERRLELLIHFDTDSILIPENCLNKLETISESTKSEKNGPLLIRSSTRGQGSTELDLALASQRLNAIQNYFRKNRLARTAFVVEIHPTSSNPLFGDSTTLSNVVEIYSSPGN